MNIRLKLSRIVPLQELFLTPQSIVRPIAQQRYAEMGLGARTSRYGAPVTLRGKGPRLAIQVRPPPRGSGSRSVGLLDVGEFFDVGDVGGGVRNLLHALAVFLDGVLDEFVGVEDGFVRGVLGGLRLLRTSGMRSVTVSERRSGSTPSSSNHRSARGLVTSRPRSSSTAFTTSVQYRSKKSVCLASS